MQFQRCWRMGGNFTGKDALCLLYWIFQLVSYLFKAVSTLQQGEPNCTRKQGSCLSSVPFRQSTISAVWPGIFCNVTRILGQNLCINSKADLSILQLSDHIHLAIPVLPQCIAFNLKAIFSPNLHIYLHAVPSQTCWFGSP